MKKCAPKKRSRNNSANVTVRIGNAKIIVTQLENTDHVNIGIFIKVIPGARILIIVTIKLIPVAKLPIPEI